MSSHAVYLQPAFILHSRKYLESSLILDVLTEDFGKLSIIAKGVKKGKTGLPGILRNFTLLKLSYTGKSELKTLTHAEAVPPIIELSQLALYCGFYISELTDCFLHKFDPHPEVFNSYRQCIQSLAHKHTLEPALRLFELMLLESTGFGLQLSQDADTGRPVSQFNRYIYRQEAGPVVSESGPFRGSTLLALSEKKLADKETLKEAKKLMRQQIDFHLQGRALKSRALMAQLFKHTQQEN